jgi:hypothetical protein
VPALSVWAVCVGDKYHPGYVYALKEAVERHLSVPHVFKCITEHELPGIQTVEPLEPYPGWWSKMNLWALATGPSLYFDLDVVITGSLDYLFPYTQHEYQFAAPANWARSGWGGIQSSVLAWRGNWSDPFDKIAGEWPGTVDADGYRTLGGKKYWGDQEYLWEMIGDCWIRIPRVYSYKYHCRSGKPPSDMAVCVFHGSPKPHEVYDEWLLPSTSILRSRISSSTGSGSRKDLSATA